MTRSTYSVSVGPDAYSFAKRVSEEVLRDNAKVVATFEELTVALVLRGMVLGALLERKSDLET